MCFSASLISCFFLAVLLATDENRVLKTIRKATSVSSSLEPTRQLHVDLALKVRTRCSLHLFFPVYRLASLTRLRAGEQEGGSASCRRSWALTSSGRSGRTAVLEIRVESRAGLR